ncbi:peptidoglycan-binding domain-containing protein [Nocardia sp. NPDC051787]|uniref:peptidoglycan-binding domain-containing protein n=1 Tax=Nocardia sp. NPDC051787 TaxID=3155415 RepID=UPI003449A2BB
MRSKVIRAAFASATFALFFAGPNLATSAPAAAIPYRNICYNAAFLNYSSLGRVDLPYNKAEGSYSCTLRQGDRGDGVVKLQNNLNRCYSADLAPDGIFGEKTRSALITAQRAAGTAADGIYGPNTKDAFEWSFLKDDGQRHCRKLP